VAQALGPYKLSLHSGSDKFSIYPIAARVAGRLLHLKTAGTSYLEALRVVSRIDGRLFRDIATLARERYAEDRASYHVSAEVAKMPVAETMTDAALPGLLEDFHAREILHVTFGSVIQDGHLKARLLGCLREHEEAYSVQIEAHFLRHFAPFR
jgi:tagaturonate epimerase